ncbi:MAG: YihY/virulence factor BrkB family protein [Myxococcales bacterium]|nr:YihY/virulence factor BrkB family protein [Myxococcales bacterium]
MDVEQRRRDAYQRTFLSAVITAAFNAQIDVQAAQIAYNAVFSLGPLLGLTTTALSLVPDEQLRQGFRAHVLPFTPDAVRPWLESQLRLVTSGPNVLVIVVSLLVLLWSVGSTTGAIATALGHVGWRLRESWLSRKLSALALGLGLVGALALAAVGASVGPRVFEWFARFVPHIGVWEALFAWVRWPIVGAVFGLVAALTYSLATIERPRWYASLTGGMISGVINVGASALLSLYLAKAPSMGAWGAAGGMFATLLWLWLLALGLLVGAVVAFVLDARWREHQTALRPKFPLRRQKGRGSARRAPRTAKRSRPTRR